MGSSRTTSHRSRTNTTRQVSVRARATVVLPDADDELRVDVAVGSGAERLPGIILPMTGSLSGQVFSSGMPVHKALSDPETAVVAAAAELDLGPVLAEARAEQQRVAMLDERDRIAADLHDHVIQRLFAAGLSLQSTAATLGPGAPTTRILATVDDLDDTIRQIRTSIFQLQQVQPRTVGGLRVRLLDVAAELTAVLGFAPALRLSALLRHPARRSGRGRRGGCAGR